MASNGRVWYPTQSSPTPEDPNSTSTTGSLREAQHLMGAYPFASATPTIHVARHLSSLTTAAVPPSYIQPSYYTPNAYDGGAPPPYNDYPLGVSLLASHNAPTRQREVAFWEASRNDAVQHIRGDVTNAYNYYPAPPSQWNSSPGPSSYQTPPFAQAVFQQAVPYNAYPTPPPPPGISTSSSSLANALGAPPAPRQERKTYHPNESKKFFDEFLNDTASRVNPPTPQKVEKAERQTPPLTPMSSPDPLAKGGFSSPLSPTPSVTPKKRKTLEVLIETPVKRALSEESMLQSSLFQRTSSTVAKSERRSNSQVYVEITTPSKRWTTPKTNMKYKKPQVPSSGDLGGYGSEEEFIRRREAQHHPNGIRSAGKRTGDRDDRAPLEKLQSFLEDIFEAEDNIPPDAQIGDLAGDFFSTLSADPNRPSLHPNLVRKLTKHMSKVARPTKRMRLSARDGSGGTPRRSGGMSEIETNVLSRILKLLERSVKVGEDLEPFGSAARKVSSVDAPTPNGSPVKRDKAKPKKKSAANGARSASPRDSEECNKPATDYGEAALMDNDESTSAELTQEDFDGSERSLELARDSVIAADCCLTLLTSDRLTKQLYSEELINSCLATVKNQLTRVVYPFVEAPSMDSREVPPLLQHIASRQKDKLAQSFHTATHRQLVGEVFQAVTAVLPRIDNLICGETVAMSDAIIIQAVYIAIGPFFVVDSGESEARGKKEISGLIHSTLGNSGMRGLRLDALSLVRSIFANYEDQRAWIIEEILTSLIKLSDSKQKAGQFRLRDGRSIRTVSALLLQLVQTSAHNVRLESARIAKSRQQQFAMRRQDGTDTQGPLVDEKDAEEIRLYTGGLDAPAKAARTIVLFLTQRSGKGKSTKNANEAEYRVILDNLISDLLAVLYWPEWPAASLVLSIICKYMISSLDDIKSAAQSDNNALKSISLDHLGIIAGRLRQSMIRCGRLSSDQTAGSDAPVPTLDELLSSTDEHQFERLVNMHQEVTSHLCKRSTEDHAYDSARELTAIMWAQELAGALSQCNAIISDEDDIESCTAVQRSKVLAFGKKVRSALRDAWKDAPTDVFDNTTQEEIERVDRLSEEIGTMQCLKNAFDPILNVILLALDAPPVFMRTKALRALSHILSVDARVLSNANVRRAIESHLRDNSPAVRDAAVELIGKYMIDSPVVAGDYFQKIAERIADTGIGVRKRVIKLLKAFYSVTDDLNRRVEICTKLVLRMLDEDDTVKDLAVKTMEELWFSQTFVSTGQGKPTAQAETSGQAAKLQLLAKVSIIMGVCGNFKDRQSPLEDMLYKIVASKEGPDVAALNNRYAEICDAMIDGLVDASDFMGFSVINCIRTIHLFSSAYPPIISGPKASTLLPYLKNPSTPEEQITSDYILKIYRASIPHMPKTAAKFGADLQKVLQPMVVKPNASAGLAALQETVACLCIVVKHLTHDFVRLVALLKSCSGRVQQFIDCQSNKAITSQDLRALTMVVYIVSLLGEHSNFDTIRAENPNVASDLNSISTGPIILHIYNSILKLYEKYEDNALRGRLLQCLGVTAFCFLFRAQPTLMTLEPSATMMDAIFASPELENQARLLKLMQEFLISESAKHAAQEKVPVECGKTKSSSAGVNMEELVGNTHGFAESGVSSAIVQRYLNQIHEAALSSDPQIQSSAVDILSFTIKQGLAHPLQSFPVIIALETSPNATISARANVLHTILHHKHASLLNTGYVKAARASYDYLSKVEDNDVKGYRMQPNPTAVLHRWYSLVREKRAARQDFLKAIMRVFDIEQTLHSTQDNINFARYMAENVASFDFKTQEEVLTVLKSLTSILSTSGSQLVEFMAPLHLLTQLRDAANGQATGSEPTSGTEATGAPGISQPANRIEQLRTSVVIGIIMILKGHLKQLYSLSEEKCSKFILGKKSAVGDRPATRRKDIPISWDRFTFVMRPIVTLEDMDEQRAAFLALWSEDGATAEPEQDEWE